MNKRFISIILFIFIAFSWFPGVSSLHAEDKHIIAGYGPVYGNLVFPTSVEIIGKQVFVLDANGVSVFSLADQQFVTMFPVDLGDTNTDRNKLGAEYWAQMIKEQSYFFPLDTCMKFSTLMNDGLIVYPELETDSSANLYISGLNGITVMSSSGEIQRVIPYPEEIKNLNFSKESKRLLFHFIHGKPYLFVQTNHFEKKNEYFTYRLYALSEEDVFTSIMLGSISNDCADVVDFTYISNKEMLVIIGSGNIEAMDKQGKFYALENYTPYFSFTQILAMEDGTVLLTCTDSSISNLGYYNKVISGLLSFEEYDYPVFSQNWTDQSWGVFAQDLCYSGDSIGIVTTGKIDSLLNFQVNVVEHSEKYLSIGKSIEDPGQIFGSVAYAVDDQGNLYTNNFGSSYIQVFDQKGAYQKRITIDRSIVTPPFEYCLRAPFAEFTPFITDMTISGHDLYITNLIPNTVCRYDMIQEKWSRLYEVEIYDVLNFHFWIEIQVVDGTVYMLDPKQDQQGMPQVYYLNTDHDLVPVAMPKSEEFDPYEIYFFTGFAIQNDRLSILEGAYNDIYQCEFPNPTEVKRIPLSNYGKNSFYSSFCITESGHYIVTDPVYNRLLKINQDGERIEAWGETSSLTIGDNRNHYLADPDAFCIPLRVKAYHNTLYINDFMNCRFHIQPMPQNVPEINVTDFFYFDDFDIFHDLDVTIPIEIASSNLIHFKVKTNDDWIQIKEPTFTSETKELPITLIGSKMKPWKNNYGYLYISCDEVKINYLNQVIVDVSVDAVGTKLQLTIDDPIVLINDKPQPPIEAAPFIIDGRTMVPVRFISESFGAEVLWDRTLKGITITKGKTVITMQIGNTLVTINGKEVKLDVPPVIRSGRTFLPLRFISEAFGAKVDYENATRRITIYYPAPEA